MSRESTRRQFLAAGGAAGAVALAGCGGNGIGGGSGSTNWYYAESNEQLSKELVSIINTRDSKDIQLLGGGTATDAAKRLHNETGEFAVIGSDIASFAMKGAGIDAISTKYETIRAVMSLYPMPVTLVARPGIEGETLNDLSGATVNAGPPSSRLAANANQIVNNSQTDFETANVPLSEAMAKLGDGSLDATFAIGDWPIPAVQEAAPDVEILGVSDKLQRKVIGSTNWFVQTQLPAGVYEGSDEMTPTLGIMSLLVTREGMDEGTVAVITDRILESAENGDIKTRGSYIPKKSSKDDGRVGIPQTVDMHDGAEQIIIYD